jgi:beta-fructofuranosidase
LLTYCPECPEIFRLGEKWIMAYSRFTDRRGTAYLTADDPRGPWRAISPDRLDGPNWYATKSLTDDDGRRIAFGWIPDRNPAPTPEFGNWLWAGDLAVPRELVLSGDDLGIRIPDEIEPDGLDIAYGPTYGSGEWKSGPAGQFEVEAAGHFGHCILDPDRPADEYVLSMSLSWAPGTAMVGVAIQTSAHLDRGAAILCYPGENRVSAVDLGSAPLSDDSGEPERSAPDYAPIAEGKLAAGPSRALALRIIVRQDLVEAFVGDRACLSYRLLTREPGQVALLMQDGSASFTQVSGKVIGVI